MHTRRDEELQMIQIGINKQLQELDGENWALQQEVVDLKKEKQDLEKLIPRQSFIDPKDAATALLQARKKLLGYERR
jgi:hypothetical protein